jgi:SAM-dependent methyltransferase
VSEEKRSQSISHWDAFWRARSNAVIQESVGVRDPAFAEFWKRFFTRALTRDRRPRVLDIACGNGAATAIAIDVARAMGTYLDVHCVDCSPSAIADLRKRFAQVEGVACDARRLPYPHQSFDVVVSQFGIEYAGRDAFAEAARLVSAGGNLTAIVHLADSTLHRECEENRSVAAAAIKSELIPLARAGFSAGFDLLAGRIGLAEFQQHERRLAAAIQTVRQIKGSRAIGAFLADLQRDIEHMFKRFRNHTPDKVFAWLDLMVGELVTYEGRMASMTKAALDDEGVARVAKDLSTAGLLVDPPGTLSLEESARPAAWILSARRGDHIS